MDKEVELLIQFIASNVEGSSLFLSPVIEYTVNVDLLLDKISEIWNISKEDIGDIVDRVREESKS